MPVASCQLWLHGRHSGLHLARQFTDYEPGIHWSQCQMQSGVTGINTIRIYSSVKQSRDHDPDGAFIRQWLPELRDVPLPFLHETWLMPEPPAGYPAPIVDLKAATLLAKEKIYGKRLKKRCRPKRSAYMKSMALADRAGKAGAVPAKRPVPAPRRGNLQPQASAPTRIEGSS